MVPLLAVALAAAPLTTEAERSGFTRTGRYAEVDTLCHAFAKRYPEKVRCESFGTTPLGRTMWMLVASGDGTFDADACAKAQRPVVMFQGGIHAGEIDGKDAVFWLLRELLDGKVDPGALDKVTLVFVPVLNVDGHERFGAWNRPNQNGPKEKGWRVTSQNLNLNRDYAKAETPEMQAVLTLLHRYDPVLYADLHVTDGAKFEHDVSVTLEPWLTGPETLRALGKALKVGLFAALEKQGHLPVGFYPSFETDDDPTSGFSYGWPPPRFANSYWSANNRFGVLVETHSWKNYQTRVKATYDVCAELLKQAADDGARWRKAQLEADAADVKRAGTDVVLVWNAAKQDKVLDFRGYAYTVTPSEVSGRPWIQYDDAKPQVWKVPYADTLEPALTVKAPKGGYLVPPPHADWVAEKLKVHGLRFTVLDGERRAQKVESMHVQPSFRSAPYEGRMTVQAKGDWAADTQDLPAGTLYVPAGQPRLLLVLDLFEPQSPDSFLAWGFFNAHLEQKEYMEPYVAEAVAREMLKDKKVKAQFDALLKDEAFARDPRARLEFFYRRHPSFDARQNLYPVYRTQRDLGR